MESAEPQPLGPGHRVGPYTIESQIGTGGSGAVYLARASVGSPVALKVLHEHLSNDPGARARMLREVTLAARLRITPIVSLVDADTQAARPWMAMEYLEGPTLEDSMPLGDERARQVGLKILDALHLLHENGVVHRDLKPSNVILTERGPVLIDLGVAAETEATRLTMTGQVLGTVSFMAPEQVLGTEVSPKTDVWAWGALMAVLTTNDKMPFASTTNHATMRRILDEEPELGGVPSWLEPICRSCLQKDPDARPDLLLLARALENGPAVLPPLSEPRRGTGATIDIEPIPSSEQAGGSSKWKRRTLAGVAALVLVAGAGAAATGILGDLTGDGSTVESAEDDPETDGEPDGQTATPAADDPDDSPGVTDTEVIETVTFTSEELGCDDSVDTVNAEQRANRLQPLRPRGLTVVDSVAPVSCRMSTIYQGHPTTARDIDQMPDSTMVTADKDAVRLWQLDNLDTAVSYAGHPVEITRARVIDNDRVASADQSGEIHVWSTSDVGETLQELNVGSAVRSLELVNDGQWLAAGTAEGELIVFDTDSWEEVLRRNDQAGEITAIITLSDGRILTGSSVNTVVLWEADFTFDVQAQMAGPVVDLAPLPDGRFAAAINDWFEIQILEPPVLDVPGPEPILLVGHRGNVIDLDVTPDGRLVSGSRDRTVRYWPLLDDSVSPGDTVEATDEFFGHIGNASEVRVLNDGQIGSFGGDTTVRVFDPLLEDNVSPTDHHLGGVLTVLPLDDIDENLWLSGGEGGRIMLWGEDRHEPLHVERDTDERGITDLLQLSTGNILSASYTGIIRMWDVGDDGIPVSVEPQGTAGVDIDDWATVLIELSGGQVLSGRASGAMELWDMGDGQSMANVEPVALPLRHGEGRIRGALELPDGRIMSIGDEPEIRVWDPFDLSGDSEVFASHPDNPMVLTMLADGRIVTAGRDLKINIWSATGELEIELPGHRSTIFDLLEMDDGRLVSTSFDGTLRIWDISDPENPTHEASEFGLAGKVALLGENRLAMGLGNGWIELNIDE